MTANQNGSFAGKVALVTGAKRGMDWKPVAHWNNEDTSIPTHLSAREAGFVIEWFTLMEPSNWSTLLSSL